MVDILMPQLGETVTEGTVTRWAKAVGESVGEDEVLFEVSTDKVDSEVRSPAAGRLAEILVGEGETVDVGVKLAMLDTGGDDTEGDAGDQTEGDGERDSGEPGQVGVAQEPGPNSPSDSPQRAPDRGPPDRGAPDRGAPDRGAPDRGAPDRGPPDRGAPDRGAPDRGAPNLGALSPVVRRLLSEHQLDPAEIPASGAGGRITRSDVLAAVDARSGAQGAPSETAGLLLDRPPLDRPPLGGPPSGFSGAGAPARPPLPAPAPAKPAAQHAGARDEVVAFSNIRRRTAEHMVRSLASAAHTLVAMEVDFEAVESVRRAQRQRFEAEEGTKLTYLPFVARAVADALAAFPHLNASVGDDCLIVHHDLHLGIAVDLGAEGLIVPVVHQAGDRRLRALAREFADLARRARSRQLSADDIAGGTFTITNPGPFGTFITVPVINQPQVAILSTDGVRRRPVVVALPDGTEGIAIRSTGVLALSFDHRAVDGAYASRFLDRVRQGLEGRDWAAEL